MTTEEEILDSARANGLSSAAPLHPTAAASDIASDKSGTLLIGPSGAGKTALLVSFGRACHFRECGEASMHFVPEKHENGDTAQLIRKGPEFVFLGRKLADANFDVVTYPCTITVEGGPDRIRETLHFRITDGPGGSIFDDSAYEGEATRRREHFQTMVNLGRDSRNLILCADAERPDLYKIEAFLNDFIEELIDPKSRRLHFDNVLILLTKIDVLVHGYYFGDAGWVSVLDHCELARMIAPVRQAVEVLGNVTLKTIHSALKDGARMAVGICSALGFDAETGGTFVDPATGEVRRLHLESGEEMLKRWRPFGIRDASYFLAGGRASGTLEMYHGEYAFVDRREFLPEIGGWTIGNRTCADSGR